VELTCTAKAGAFGQCKFLLYTRQLDNTDVLALQWHSWVFVSGCTPDVSWGWSLRPKAERGVWVLIGEGTCCPYLRTARGGSAVSSLSGTWVEPQIIMPLDELRSQKMCL